MAEPIRLDRLLQCRSRIGNRNEPLPGFFRSNQGLNPCEEVLLEDVGFEGGPGLTGDDEEGAGKMYCPLDSVDSRDQFLSDYGDRHEASLDVAQKVIAPDITSGVGQTIDVSS